MSEENELLAAFWIEEKEWIEETEAIEAKEEVSGAWIEMREEKEVREGGR